MTNTSSQAHGTPSRASQFVDWCVYFSFWSTAQSRVAQWSRSRQLVLFSIFASIGIAARMWAELQYRNYDFDSYVIVSDAVLAHSNPYESGRYNYGPVWFLVLAGLRSLAENPDRFRLAIAMVLMVADVGIAFVLMHRRYLPAGCLLLVSPVSIAISGQHQQFDNVAILLALLAVLFIPKDPLSRLNRSDVAVVALLALSLATKHVFIVLPVWLAIQQRSRPRALTYLVAPALAFGLSFVPFLVMNAESVKVNVLGYRSSDNAPFLTMLLPDSVAKALALHGLAVPIFLLLLATAGLLYRRQPAFETTLIYTVSVVVFSSAMADQYLAIAMVGAAVFMNVGFLAWLLLASTYLAGRESSMGVWGFTQLRPYLTPMDFAAGTYVDLLVPLFVGWLLMTAWLGRDPRR